MQLDQIVEEASQLPIDVIYDLVDRLELAAQGLNEGHRFDPQDVDRFSRRLSELTSHSVEGIPRSEVSSRILTLLQK
jgi:hypothetical protein